MSREAFKISRYFTKSGINFRGLVEDLAGLGLEASKKRLLEMRVNPFILKMVGDMVINPALGLKDIASQYTDVTALDSQEKLAGLAIRDCLTTKPLDTLCVWISPKGGPLNYSEGRVVVGINRPGHMESYGICMDFDATTCKDIAGLLHNLEKHGNAIEDPEELRSRVFIIENAQKPWEMLRDIIPLPKVWDSIESGQAQVVKQKAIEDATRAVMKVLPWLKRATGWLDQILVGTFLEQAMANMGYGLMGGLCGFLNSEVFGNFLYTNIRMNSQGTVLNYESGNGKLVERCGKCGIYIGEKISKGYQCVNEKCKGVYEGC